MLEINTFQTIIENTPLISIDFIISDEQNKVLLGKRLNRPAQNYLFTVGGRVYKNETLQNAKKRILRDETGLHLLDYKTEFIGVFEHFYNDSFVSNSISTHYVNFVYEIRVLHKFKLPKLQHNEYYWLSLEELLKHNEVHPYVKDYFG